MIATTLMFVGLTSIVVLALRGSSSSPLKGLPVVAHVSVRAAEESRSGETTTASDDVAPLSKESLQSTQTVKGQSAELKTQASLGLPSEVPQASQSANTMPVRTATLPPDGAPIATPVSIESSPPAHTPKPARSGPVAADSRKQILPQPPVKPDGAGTDAKSPRAATAPIPGSEAPGEAIRQSFNRVLHTIGGLIDARNPPAAQSDSVSALAGCGPIGCAKIGDRG
jgi:hypothetical protein